MLLRLTTHARVSAGYVGDEPYSFSFNYNEFCESNEFEENYSSEILFLMNVAFLTLRDAPRAIEMTMEEAPDGAVLTDAQIEVNAEKVRKAAVLTASLPAAMQWFADLVSAHQMRHIKNDNIKNYFLQKDISGVDNSVLCKMISFYSVVIPNINADNDARATIEVTKWNEYHHSYSQTASLCNRFINDLPNVFATMVSPAGRAAVTASLGAPYDRALNEAIPNDIVAKAKIYLDISKVDYGGESWYQGKKAISLFSPAKAVLTKSFFSKYFEILRSNNAIDKAKSLEELAVGAASVIFDTPVDAAVTAAAVDNKTARVTKILSVMQFEENRRFALDPARVAPHVFTVADVNPIVIEDA